MRDIWKDKEIQLVSRLVKMYITFMDWMIKYTTTGRLKSLFSETLHLRLLKVNHFTEHGPKRMMVRKLGDIVSLFCVGETTQPVDCRDRRCRGPGHWIFTGRYWSMPPRCSGWLNTMTDTEYNRHVNLTYIGDREVVKKKTKKKQVTRKDFYGELWALPIILSMTSKFHE